MTFEGSEAVIFEINLNSILKEKNQKNIAIKLYLNYIQNYDFTIHTNEDLERLADQWVKYKMTVQHEILINQKIHKNCENENCCNNIIKYFGESQFYKFNLEKLRKIGWNADEDLCNNEMGFFLMELFPESLKQRIEREGRMNERQSLTTILQIAKGIKFLQSKFVNF